MYESSEDSLYSIAITGGGVKAVDWLLSVPGASSRILEVVVPYSIPSLRKYLGKSIEKSVSLDTACFWLIKLMEKQNKNIQIKRIL